MPPTRHPRPLVQGGHRNRRESVRLLHRRRGLCRRRCHRPQDHRGHLRRDGAPRRRCLQRQGPIQGGPFGGVLLPVGRAPDRHQGPGPTRRGAGGLRHRPRSPGVGVRRDLGTADHERAEAFVRRFDFRPASIIRKLDLLRPIYRRTTNYGHFGRPGLPWER